MIDGRKEKVGNFRVEPPGLFRGRGAHPKAGTLKRRVMPEQITINISQGSKVPHPPKDHHWQGVVHNSKAMWLATWTENVNNATKYVWLAATSSLKGINDMKKYDKARELKKHIAKIRKQYMQELFDSQTTIRQRATALYLIDKLALRAGNEKDTDEEADTVGCCSLRVEHIVLEDPNVVIFDFLGKDSMRYYNEVPVDTQVFKNLAIFKRGKKDEPKVTGDLLFDRIDTTKLNEHLKSLMPGLSAKVFRTYNASITFQDELRKTPDTKTVADLVLAYNRANRQAAILCNHQRSVPKALQGSLQRIDDKIILLKLERYRWRTDALEQTGGNRKKKSVDVKRKRAQVKEEDEDEDEEEIQVRKKKRNAKVADCDDDDDDDDDVPLTKRLKKEPASTVISSDLNSDDKPLSKLKPTSAPKISKEVSKPEDLDEESDFDDDAIEEAELLEKRTEDEKETKKKKQAEEKGEKYEPPEPKKRRRSDLSVEQLMKKILDIDERIYKLKIEKMDKDENKTTALGTSKINYLDPRITVAWCKKHSVPIEKVFNKSLVDKFRWAIESAGPDFVF